MKLVLLGFFAVVVVFSLPLHFCLSRIEFLFHTPVRACMFPEIRRDFPGMYWRVRFGARMRERGALYV